MLQSQVLGQDITRRTLRFFVRHRPPSCLPDIKHVTLSPRPSPSVFAYCKQSKTGGGNSLGTRLQVGNRYLLEASSHNFDYYRTSVRESPQLWKLVLEPLVSASNSHIGAEIDLCYYNQVIVCKIVRFQIT